MVPPGRPLRLGVYADLRYFADTEGTSSDTAFVRFPGVLAEHVGHVTLFGRLDPQPGRGAHPVPVTSRLDFVPLPSYPSLTSARATASAWPGTKRAFAQHLGGLDAVLLFGPHPFSLALARLARQSGVQVVLGVRQDFPSYMRSRARGVSRAPVIIVANALEHAYRRLARTAPTIVVGEAVAHRYRRATALLSTGISLTSAEDVVSVLDAEARSWSGDLRLITVGRLDPEKNPLLLADVLAELLRSCPRWSLVVAGGGTLLEALRERGRRLGVSASLDLRGEVTFGAELVELYRSSSAFLHVSFTEGVPQVLFEAQAAGLPIVATDVGGVRKALGDGALGLLVPPADASAAAAAVERLRLDRDLRLRLVRAGLEHALRESTEVHAARIAGFIEEHRLPSRGGRGRSGTDRRRS